MQIDPFSFRYICGLTKIVVILYVVCFGCYILFTRQPDYFDSEITEGMIIQRSDSLVAQYSNGREIHYASVPYTFLHEQGDHVKVIYETSTAATAKVYAVIGYWITFGELMASLCLIFLMYQIAVNVTKNPTPEAVVEELEMGKKKPRKPKYDL